MKSVYVRGWKQLHEIEEFAKQTAKGTVLEDVGLIQIHVLDALYEEDGQHASNLARQVDRQVTSFTPILDKLEKRGLIRREADTNDRRAVFIFLTDAGKSLKVEVGHVMDCIGDAYTFKPFAVKQ